MYLFLDLEFTGLTDFNVSYKNLSNYDKARIISLSYVIVDKNQLENIVKEYHSVVKPDNFIIPNESIQIHHIDNDFANLNGKKITDIFDEIEEDFHNCELLFTYFISADYNVLCSELFRYQHRLLKKIAAMRTMCVFEYAKKYFYKRSRPKTFKLIDVYKTLTGGETFPHHNSLEDAKACYKVYKLIKNDFF